MSNSVFVPNLKCIAWCYIGECKDVIDFVHSHIVWFIAGCLKLSASVYLFTIRYDTIEEIIVFTMQCATPGGNLQFSTPLLCYFQSKSLCFHLYYLYYLQRSSRLEVGRRA